MKRQNTMKPKKRMGFMTILFILMESSQVSVTMGTYVTVDLY